MNLVNRVFSTPLCLLLAGLALASTGCIVKDSDDGADGEDGEGGATSATGPAAGTGGDAASAGGGDAGSGGNGAGAGGGSSDLLGGVGPSGDPAPEASEPGAYDCDGCPEAVMDTADLDVGTDTLFTFTGTVDGQAGQGHFLVLSESGQFSGGGVLVDPDSGDFEQVAPLFCGTSLLKVFFTNDAGTSTFVRRITNSGCLPSDVRVTIAWDETTRQWTNHLVRFGGTIGDASTDCYARNTCYPGSHTTDWGVDDDNTDNPVMDTYGFPSFMGIENIYYPNAEDGLKVLIEQGGDVDGLTPAGTLYINVHDQPTYVKQIDVLHPKEVLIAAKVDGAAGEIEVIDEIYDCAGEWNLGCEADIP
jgi:hypothetical protein